MTTTYEAPTPSNVRGVVDAAVASWDESLTLSPSAPLEISVLWSDLGPRLLGQAGTEGEYRDREQFPTDRWYPAALANQLANFDVNGAQTPEILIELNSGLGDDWYIGTDGTPAFGQIDLYSVVLHEIAHGLGFLGSATATRTGTVRVDHSPPSIYDDFVLNADGQRLVDLDNASAVAALTSRSLRFDIGFGRLMPLSAPSRFVNGSSYSHFDESIPESEAGAMMTPALKNGEVQRHIDAAVLGVLDQVGWDLDTPLMQPTIAEVEAHSGALEMVWSEDWSQRSALSMSYEISVSPRASSEASPPPILRLVEAGRTGSISLQGLQNGTAYGIAITGKRPNHSAGSSARTSVLLPSNPNPVKDLVNGPIGGVTLTWRPPVATGEPVTGYEVQYRNASDIEWVTETTTSTEWTGSLRTGRYWFRVRGVNRTGGGLWTESGLIGLSAGPVRPMPLDGQLGRLYAAYLGRRADARGMEYWRNVRANGTSLEAVAESFGRSREFRMTYGDLSDTQFVERLYQIVLERSPDPDGYDYWLGMLKGGSSRGSVVLAFSESPEFIRTTSTAAPQSSADGAVERMHIALLHRAPTPTQLAALRRGQASVDLSGLASIAGKLRRTPEFGVLWGTTDERELLEAIASSVGETERAVARLLTRLADGESFDRLLVELTQSAAFVVITGTAP
jgi:hypothetical protein